MRYVIYRSKIILSIFGFFIYLLTPKTFAPFPVGIIVLSIRSIKVSFKAIIDLLKFIFFCSGVISGAICSLIALSNTGSIIKYKYLPFCLTIRSYLFLYYDHLIDPLAFLIG